MMDAVDEAELQRLAPRPESAAEELGFIPLEALTAAIADQVHEILVEVYVDGGEMFHVGIFLVEEGIEHAFVNAGGVQAAFHTHALKQALETDSRTDDPDGADDQRGLGINLVAGAGQLIAAGRCHILGEGEHRHVVLGRQGADTPGNQSRLYWRTAG